MTTTWTNFSATVLADPKLPEEVKQEGAAAAETSANFASTDQVESAAEEAGLPADQTAALVAMYSDAQLTALRAALASLALFALVALAYVRHLPERPRPAPESGHP